MGHLSLKKSPRALIQGVEEPFEEREALQEAVLL